MGTDRSAPVRVLIADAVSEAGIELLRSTPGFEVTVQTGMNAEELQAKLEDHDALIVRSATKVTADVLKEPGRLRVIGRAGTGVDNIHLPSATQAGIVVMNTPGGNSVAAAELTLAHLLSLARNVSQASSDLRDGRWERKKYMGVEVAGKVLGVVGLGRIGREVARAARGLRMEVLGYDPFVSDQLASDQGIKLLPLDELMAQSDFITLHIPRTDETKHLIDAEMLKKIKPGARIINCARGGLIDEAALLEALDSGHIAGAALDVFEVEPPEDLRLVKHASVVATPHLGASTREAQVRVGTEIAEKIRNYLEKGVIRDAVNFPAIDSADSKVIGPLMDLTERLGSFLSQISQGGFRRLELRTFGTLAVNGLKPVTMAAVKGLLSPIITAGAVSYVNAMQLADERGITVDEGRSSESATYSGLVRLTLQTDDGETTVAGTLYGAEDERLVEVAGVPIEAHLSGNMLFIRNHDVPGVVGKIGTILGRSGVNIAGIQLGRVKGQDNAVSIIDIDGPVGAECLKEIGAIEELFLVRAVSI